jgi:response regulator of citrate/malate metabolism
MTKPTLKILVIEDEEEWKRLLSELIQEVAQSLECDLALEIKDSCAEALDIIADNSLDLVTIDKKLRDGDRARVLLDCIEQCTCRPFVFVVSGVSKPDEVRDYFKAYHVHDFFFKKGFKVAEFRNTLRAKLKLRIPDPPISSGH